MKLPKFRFQVSKKRKFWWNAFIGRDNLQLFVIEYYMDGEKTFPSSFEIIILVITIIITIAHMDVGGVNTNAKTHLNETESCDFFYISDNWEPWSMAGIMTWY